MTEYSHGRHNFSYFLGYQKNKHPEADGMGREAEDNNRMVTCKPDRIRIAMGTKAIHKEQQWMSRHGMSQKMFF